MSVRNYSCIRHRPWHSRRPAEGQGKISLRKDTVSTPRHRDCSVLCLLSQCHGRRCGRAVHRFCGVLEPVGKKKNKRHQRLYVRAHCILMNHAYARAGNFTSAHVGCEEPADEHETGEERGEMAAGIRLFLENTFHKASHTWTSAFHHRRRIDYADVLSCSVGEKDLNLPPPSEMITGYSVQ